jgi:tetratricopeptide (TPR) repeat protein
MAMHMSDENRDNRNAIDLVHRFEQMISSNDSYYFDIDQFEEIIEFYCENNKFPLALRAIEHGYNLFPENMTLMLRESQILTGMGHLTRALKLLKKLEKVEASEEVLLTLASIYSQQREHAKSIQLLRKALALGSSEYADDIYLEIALEYENMQRFDKAQEILQEAILKRPENEVLLYELAYVFDINERSAESIEYYQKFLESYPFSFPAWYNLANAYQKVGQLSEALECYDYCLAIQEDFTPAYYNKAHTLFKMERYQDAVQVFEETYAYEPPQAPVYCHIGECFEKLNQYDKALFYYRKSIQVDEFYADAFLGIGITMDLMGKTLEALGLIERAIEIEPENPDYYLFQIEFLKKLDRVSEAETIAETIITKFVENEDLWMDYSDIFFMRGEYDKALSTIQTGWQHCPQSNDLGFRQVAYLIQAGKTGEAEELMFRMAMRHAEGLNDLEEYFPEIKNNLLYIELRKQLLS